VRWAACASVVLGDLGQACELGEWKRMERRPRRERERRVAAALDEETRAKRHAPFALAPPGAEAGVALERLDVVVTT
jgi:hypothetical protein